MGRRGRRGDVRLETRPPAQAGAPPRRRPGRAPVFSASTQCAPAHRPAWAHPPPVEASLRAPIMFCRGQTTPFLTRAGRCSSSWSCARWSAALRCGARLGAAAQLERAVHHQRGFSGAQRWVPAVRRWRLTLSRAGGERRCLPRAMGRLTTVPRSLLGAD